METDENLERKEPVEEKSQRYIMRIYLKEGGIITATVDKDALEFIKSSTWKGIGIQFEDYTNDKLTVIHTLPGGSIARTSYYEAI